MNCHFILFERSGGDQPYSECPVGVYDSKDEAEENQLARQRDKADSYNTRRHAAFTEGWGCPSAQKADDFKDDFHITEVLTP